METLRRLCSRAPESQACRTPSESIPEDGTTVTGTAPDQAIATTSSSTNVADSSGRPQTPARKGVAPTIVTGSSGREKSQAQHAPAPG